MLADWMGVVLARLTGVFPNDEYENRKTWRILTPYALYIQTFKVFKLDRGDLVMLHERCGRCLPRDGRYGEAEELLAQGTETRREC